MTWNWYQAKTLTLCQFNWEWFIFFMDPGWSLFINLKRIKHFYYVSITYTYYTIHITFCWNSKLSKDNMDSLGQNDTILQPFLKAFSDGHSRHLLDPKSELFLLLQVVFLCDLWAIGEIIQWVIHPNIRHSGLKPALLRPLYIVHIIQNAIVH